MSNSATKKTINKHHEQKNNARQRRIDRTEKRQNEYLALKTEILREVSIRNRILVIFCILWSISVSAIIFANLPRILQSMVIR